MEKHQTIILSFTIVFVAVFVFYLTTPKETGSACGTYDEQLITVANTTFNVEIADTECKQVLGLSGRKALAPGTGMLFVFPTEDFHGFWMKDMLFPLDMIWLDSTHTVVALEQNVSPTTYPTPFGTNVLSKFVLELPAGFASQYFIKIGDTIEF